MSLYLISAAIITAALSGIPGLFFPVRSRVPQRIALVMLLFSFLLSAAGIGCFFTHQTPAMLLVHWTTFGKTIISIDALSAFFLVPVFLMGLLGALYGLGYWPQARHPSNSKKISFFWGFLIAGMALLVISKHAILFLFGWEIMALAAFFLVSSEDNRAESRSAGLVYLIATHIGTLILFMLFALWHHITGSYLFVPVASGSMGPGLMNIFFVLAIVGFGLKAGMIPFHFWLPAAHATAPTHISAILSGVVLKIGIYGLIRWLSLFPDPPNSWGTIITILGLISGLFGVVFAIAQHDLKKLLAYHSIENIGIIMIGLGIALLGRAADKPELVILGMAGCLLHVWNHSFFKSLLFFGAGAVIHHTHTRQIDKLGGLLKKMPLTAGLFLTGAVAICGLPPLNGFISEWLIYLGLFRMVLHDIGYIAAAFGVPVLAMIGALAAACFVKVFGTIFLGNPRSELAREGSEAPRSMLISMIILASLCLMIGVLPVTVNTILYSAIVAWDPQIPQHGTISSVAPFSMISVIALFLIVAVSIMVIIMRLLKKTCPQVGTWDCGYARPVSSMQYTASSFAHSIMLIFQWILKPNEHTSEITGNFPKPARYSIHVDELVLDRVINPVVHIVQGWSLWIRRFQQGLIQYYIFYIVVMLFVLLCTQVPFKSYVVHWFTR